jgi:hypothetical protein
MTDPRNDPREGDPVTRRSESAGGMWGWIAGIAVLALIAIILIAGWNSPNNTASNPSPAATTGSAVAPIPMTPPASAPPASATGAATPTHPMTPEKPAAPAPSKQ